MGGRQFADIGSLGLELGGRLDRVRVAYETWGTLNPDASNAVLVLHALTGDSHVDGSSGPGHPTPGWWDGLVGPDAPLDTSRWFVVAPNVLGALLDFLGIDRLHAVIGGSMGGMRALEWAVGSPDRTASALVLAVGATSTADQIATQTTQEIAITSDPRWRGGDYHDAAPGDGPSAGLGVARRIAHITYRSDGELQSRFGNDAQDGEDPRAGGRFAVQSYLDHHADKLAHRFDAGSYVVLTDAMSTWDVGRGRGGVEQALSDVHIPMVVGGIDSDRLYPLRLQQQIADLVPGAVGGLRVISSPYGHDGFLVERDRVFALVEETLGLVKWVGAPVEGSPSRAVG